MTVEEEPITYESYFKSFGEINSQSKILIKYRDE